MVARDDARGGMTETEVSAALAAARALVSPPDHASLVAADAHLRATQASASGWVVARAILGARGEALEVRALGATMLRAKARSEGFAMTPSDAAAMTGEVLSLLGGPDGATALGPHLASLAAAVSAAGGAHTLADLISRAVAHAAPDAAGGWPADGTLAVGPHAHAAVALLAAAAEESLHRPRAHDRDVVAATRDALEDVLWVLDAVLSAPSPTVVSHDARAAAFACLDAWIPAGVTLSELRTERPGALAALVAAATRDGQQTATNALAALISAVDPLPGRSEAIAHVLDAAAASVDALAAFPPERVFRDEDEGTRSDELDAAGTGAGAGAGIESEPFVAVRRVARAVVAVVSACACSEPRATASSRGAASFVRFLLAAARLGGARTAAEAFAPWRRAAGGFVAAFDEPTRGVVAAEAAEAALARLAALEDGRRDAEREAAEADAAREADGYGASVDAYGASDDGYGASDDAFADGDLALVPDAEATLAAAHASLGSERFFDLALRRAAIGVESESSSESERERERERDAAAARAAMATCGYPLSADADVPPAARRAMRFILGDDDTRRHPHRRPSARALAWSARALRGALHGFLRDPAALEEAARRIVFPGIVGGGDGVVGDRLDRRILADAACDALGAIFASEAPAGSKPVVDAALERWARLDASEDPIGAESRDVDVDVDVDVVIVRASERRRAATTRAACAYATSTSARDPHRARNAVDALANAYCDRLAKAAAASSESANATIPPSFCAACASLAAWCSSGAPTLASDATLVAVWSATEAAASLATSRVHPSRRELRVVASCCASWRGLASSLTWPGREAHAIRALQATSARLVASPGAVACAPALLDVAAATIRVCGESASDDAAALAAKIVRDVSVGVDAMLPPRAGSSPAVVTGPENEHHPALEPETFVALFDAAAALVAADVSSDPWDATLLAHVSRCVSSEHFDVSNAALQLQTAAWSSRRVGDALSRVARRHAANDAGASMEPMDAALEAWAAQLAAQAATRDVRRMMEPTANAMWAAGRAARERGAGSWLARAYARGAAAAQTVAGAVAEADILAFADAAATRDPPHAPRRLEELLVAFGRACRGVGPASEIADFK